MKILHVNQLFETLQQLLILKQNVIQIRKFVFRRILTHCELITCINAETQVTAAECVNNFTDSSRLSKHQRNMAPRPNTAAKNRPVKPLPALI